MEKKDDLIKLAFVLLFLLSLIFIISLSSSQETNQGEEIKKQIGINPEEIPSDPEELRNKYLMKDWEELINKNKILGPIHRFLKSFFLIKLLLGEPYSLSVIFLLIFIFWFIVGAKIGAFIEVYGIIKSYSALAVGFLLSIILAQIGLYKSIAMFMASVVLKESSGWVRLIIVFAWFLVIALILFLTETIKGSLKKSREEKEKKEQKDTREKVDTLTEEITSN